MIKNQDFSGFTTLSAKNRSWAFRLAALFALLVLLFLINISVGSVSISIEQIIRSLFGFGLKGDILNQIIWQFRLPKAATCVLAGASLSVGGLLMQTLFRNPLAGPDVLGLSSGASLMVALVLLLGNSGGIILPFQNNWTLALAASMGSGAIFLIVLSVSSRLKDNTSLLIIGLMIGAVAASVVSVLQFMSKADELQIFMIWTMGNVGSTDWNELLVLAMILVAGCSMAIGSVKAINAWLLGDFYAQSLGVNLRKSRMLVLLATSMLTGGVTAFCGPISFVGLAVPHLVRLLVPTSDHRVLIPMVVFGGGALLLLCDLVAQLPGTSSVLPLNAITSIVGAPVVIWIVVRNRRFKI